jgi:predicted transcriptional regulator
MHYTQVQIAEIIGVTQAAVSKWYKGIRPSPLALEKLKEKMPELYEKFSKNERKNERSRKD